MRVSSAALRMPVLASHIWHAWSPLACLQMGRVGRALESLGALQAAANRAVSDMAERQERALAGRVVGLLP